MSQQETIRINSKNAIYRKITDIPEKTELKSKNLNNVLSFQIHVYKVWLI